MRDTTRLLESGDQRASYALSMSGVVARSVQLSGSPPAVREAAWALAGFAPGGQAPARDATPTSPPTARAVAAARNLARSGEAATTDVFTAAHHAATYTAAPAPALVGQTMTIPVTVRNFGAGV